MRIAPFATLVALAVLAAGCADSSSEDSAEEFKGDARIVATVVEDLEEAGRDEDAEKICRELLADSLVRRQRQGGTNCDTAVDEALEDADSFDLEVQRVRINGANATVQVRSGSGDDEKDDTLTLHRDGRAWKISSLSAAQ